MISERETFTPQSYIVAFLMTFTLLLVSCSSHEVTIPFEKQYVKGTLIKLDDALLAHIRPDTIAAIPKMPIPDGVSFDTEFHVLKQDSVVISYYDAKGSLIPSSFRDYLFPGLYVFKPTDLYLNSGVYYIRCRVGKDSFIRKALVMH